MIVIVPQQHKSFRVQNAVRTAHSFEKKKLKATVVQLKADIAEYHAGLEMTAAGNDAATSTLDAEIQVGECARSVRGAHSFIQSLSHE